MTVGTISTRILTDIANAIRFKAGVATTYKPREMAAAVAALDGTGAGEYTALPYKELESGVVSDSVFGAIADAIRGQNGETTLYAPGDMAAAILALTWDVGLKPRALLLSDGTLEFNYLDRRRSTLGLPIVDAWEVSTAGYASSGARPWDSSKLQVTKVAIDSSVAGVGFSNCAYWFYGCTNLVEVTGFENLSGMTTATQMFASCASLETIYARSFTNAITSGSMMFYGCSKLVGGTDGFVPGNTSAASVCKLGAGGVLTDPAADNREWCYANLYGNGLLEFMVAPTPTDPALCVNSGRLCANAKYNAVGILPGYDQRSSMKYVFFREDMAGLAYVNMNYWFYGLGGITSVQGAWNLPEVRSMRYAFTSCTGLVELDLSGMSPSGLTDLAYAFSGCTALEEIVVDSDWALPATGVSGAQTFYNCPKLVGGNGTAWSSSNVGYAYMRIDKAGSPGYLTAA